MFACFCLRRQRSSRLLTFSLSHSLDSYSLNYFTSYQTALVFNVSFGWAVAFICHRLSYTSPPHTYSRRGFPLSEYSLNAFIPICSTAHLLHPEDFIAQVCWWIKQSMSNAVAKMPLGIAIETMKKNASGVVLTFLLLVEWSHFHSVGKTSLLKSAS